MHAPQLQHPRGADSQDQQRAVVCITICLFVVPLEAQTTVLTIVSGYQQIHKSIDELFVYTALSVPRAVKLFCVTYRAAQQNIERLVESKILREVTGQKRTRVFLAEEIVRTIEV